MPIRNFCTKVVKHRSNSTISKPLWCTELCPYGAGTIMRDYLRVGDLTHVPDELIATYL